MVAIVVGAWGGYTLYDNIANKEARTEASVEQVVNRGVTLNVPALTTYAAMDDATILSTITAAGFTYADMNTINNSSEANIDIMKLPSDVTLTDAMVAYAKGITSLDGKEAAKYLSGSWRLIVSRSEYFDMRVKYADFTSGSSDAAVTNAMTTQGFDPSTVTDSGTDTSGNTYKTGTVVIGAATYAWSISVCPLSYVYSNDGLPATAQYVGVRLYA